MMLSSDLGQARKDKYYDNIIYGTSFSMGFAALHAKVNGISSEDVLNKLYLDALRSTVYNFKIEKMRAFGFPLTDESIDEEFKALSVRIDGKGRMTIPQYVRAALGWTPGDSLQPRIDFEKGEITPSLVKAKRPLCVPLESCERFLAFSSSFSVRGQV